MGHADGRRWSAAFQPLADAIEQQFLTWLPRATYPLRTGMHSNSAFGLSRALPYAGRRPDGALSQALREAATRWYLADEDYPGAWDPWGRTSCRPRCARPN